MYTLAPIFSQSFSLSTLVTKVLHLLQMRDLHQHIIITQSLQFTVALGVTHSNKFMSYIHIWQHPEQFQCPKIPLCFSDSFLFSPNPSMATTDFFYCFHNFAFSRMSQSWNHTVLQPVQMIFHVMLCIFSSSMSFCCSFLFSAESFHCLTNEIIYSPAEEHLGCFHVLALMNDVAITMHRFLCIH